MSKASFLIRSIIIAFTFFTFYGILATGQCSYDTNYQRKVDRINYDMDIVLDPEIKSASGHQKIEWTNHSPDTLNSMRFYMYLNAFKNLKSTYLRDTDGKVFGNDITKRSAHEWGWVNINSFIIDGEEHKANMVYIQPDDGNVEDESVLEVQLKKPLLPGEKVTIDMDFESKLPKTIARAGYGRENYYLFVHWFPQPGVYEQDENGNWGWNCHQFMQHTEFYADFGNYNVDITLPKDFVIGASGCKVGEVLNEDNTKTVTFDARDIVNFAWSVYPLFDEYHDEWEGVEITMLIPPEHCKMAPRYLGAIKNALAFFESYMGKYPYPSITLVDPPMHALNSGFMEYPMLITCASFHYVPDGIRTIESLAIHEFAHQFFMAILASNEKEAPWLDEGFVTFFEDDIIDYSYGGIYSSLFEIFGYKSGNKEQSRLEYTSLPNPRIGTIARPGWEFKSAYKELIYAKTATMLQTLKGLVGNGTMKKIMQHYYQKNKFTHPREKDWVDAVKFVVGDSINNYSVDLFFYQCLHTTGICDYAITNISSELNEDGDYISSAQMERLGELIFPQEIRLHFEDGSSKLIWWDGAVELNTHIEKYQSPLISAIIDPDKKIYLDLNFTNNSMSQKIEKKPSVNFGMKTMSFVQHLFQSAAFLF